MEAMNVLIIPSISAIAIKILIIWFGRYSLHQISKWACVFFLALFGMNAIELIGFVFQRVASEWVVLFFLSSYYAFAVLSAISFLAVSLQLSNMLTHKKNASLLGISAIGVAVSLVPGLGLSGAETINYSFTRIPGPLYWILQFTIPVGWLCGLGVLAYIKSRGKGWFARRRACALLIGAAPIGLGIFLIAVLMQLGFKINATLIFSIATNFLFAVLIYTEYEHRLFRFLSNVPATEERRLIYQAISTIADIDKYDLPSMVRQFERALISDSLRLNNDNKTKAAKSLGISKTTLNRKLASV